jgi:hypothetical protein
MFNLYVFTIIANYCRAVKFFSAVVAFFLFVFHIPPAVARTLYAHDKGWRAWIALSNMVIAVEYARPV